MRIRDMSSADKIWFRQELKSAVSQVLNEEFGEVLQFLRSVKETANVVVSETEETENGQDGGEDVGREAGDQDVPV